MDGVPFLGRTDLSGGEGLLCLCCVKDLLSPEAESFRRSADRASRFIMETELRVAAVGVVAAEMGVLEACKWRRGLDRWSRRDMETALPGVRGCLPGVVERDDVTKAGVPGLPPQEGMAGMRSVRRRCAEEPALLPAWKDAVIKSSPVGEEELGLQFLRFFRRN